MMFDVVSASVQGSQHRVSALPNQDAAVVLRRGERLVGVVCDGCGSAPASGVGAYLGARLVADAVLGSSDFSEISAHVVAKLASIAETVASESFLAEACLFTIVGVVIDPDHATFFALGDGLIGCNDEVITLGPFADNAPPYLAYRLLDGRDVAIEPVLVRDARSVERFFIATDGALELASTQWPAELSDPRFHTHPDALRRRLTQLTLPQNGARSVLTDDTTVILAKRGV